MTTTPMTPRLFEELVTIGRLIKPQGRKGEVLAEVLSDHPERFPSLRRAFVPGEGGQAREVTISSRWPHKGRFVLKFEGVDSIDEAEALRGVEIRIGEEELRALPEGSYYHHQLKGLRVEDPQGTFLGVVEDVMVTGGENAVLVVRGPAGEFLMPLAATFVRRVALDEGRLVAIAPDFLETGTRRC